MRGNHNLARSITAIALAACLLAMPQAALGSNQTFANVHYLVSTGEKAKEVKARLVLTDGSVQVQGYRGGSVLHELSYADIRSATYF